MKKILAFITSIPLVTTLFIAPAYANKAGVNLGGIWNDKNMEKAGQMVGTGGWITVLSCELEKLEPALAKALDANIILRLYNGGSVFTPEDAIAFVNMLGKLNTGGRKIFVVPWNEPNMAKECGGNWDCTGYVNAWASALRTHIASAGIREKIVLLSPPLNHTCPASACMTAQEFAGKVSFNSFDGIALNLYKQGVPSPSDVTDYLNTLGVSGKDVFVTETGPLNPGVIYDDNAMLTFIGSALSNWSVRAIAPLAYDPEPSPENPWLFGWDGENCQKTCGLFTNYARSNPGAVERGGSVGPYTAAGCTGGADEPPQCQVSAQYCSGMIRSCAQPQTPEKNDCCPIQKSANLGADTFHRIIGIARDVLGLGPDDPDNPDSNPLRGLLYGGLAGNLEGALNNLIGITATITYQNVVNPGENLRNFTHGEPILEAEQPDEESGPAMIAYSREGSGYWGNGLSDYLSLPNSRSARTQEWKTPVETEFKSNPQGSYEPVDGEPSEAVNLRDAFDIEPTKYALNSLGFSKFPESATPLAVSSVEEKTSDATTTILPQQSILSAQDEKCLPPDTNDITQSTCESSSPNQPEEISIRKAFQTILDQGLGFQTIMSIPFAKDFERIFWGKTESGVQEGDMGMMNIFKLPGEEESKALPAQGKAKATIEFGIATPAFFRSFAQSINSVLCHPPLINICVPVPGETISLAERDVDVELKYRGMGVLGDLQKIGQKLDYPETSEITYESETQNYSSNPVSLASAIGGHALGEQTVPEEEPLTLPEKIGQFLGRIIAKIIIPN